LYTLPLSITESSLSPTFLVFLGHLQNLGIAEGNNLLGRWVHGQISDASANAELSAFMVKDLEKYPLFPIRHQVLHWETD